MAVEISDAEMKEALARSGYMLEGRVEDLLAQRGYMVDANIGYPDPVEGKTRELDARAMNGTVFSDERDSVWSTLLIECANNPQPLALITKRRDDPLAYESVPLAGIPLLIAGESVQRVLALQDFHHDCEGLVATQFCSFQPKKKERGGAAQVPRQRRSDPEWMACHDEGEWSSMKKLADALRFDQQELEASWRWEDTGDPEPINLTVYYCILVLQGRLVEVEAGDSRKDPRTITRGLLRRPLVWHRPYPRDHYVDVVTEEGLPPLIDAIEEERAQVVRRLRARLEQFRRAAAEEASQRRRAGLRALLRSPPA